MESEFKVRRNFSRYFVIAFDKCDIVYNAIVNKISKVRCIGQTLWKNIFGNRVSRAIKKLSTIKSIRILEKSLTLLAELFIYLGGSLAGRGSIGIKGEKDILTEPL